MVGFLRNLQDSGYFCTFAAHFSIRVVQLYTFNITQAHMKRISKIIIAATIAALTAIGAAVGLSSCNVTRVITNEAQYLQRGDTSVVIHTKTIESYDGTKK